MNAVGSMNPRESDSSRSPRQRTSQLLSSNRARWMLGAALMSSAIGLSVGLTVSSSATVTSSSAMAGHLAPGSGTAGGPGSGGGASNARSAPAQGGASGTVATASKSSFTITTSAGQKVTVDEVPATKYQKGTDSASASAITKGERVLALGTTSSTTIKATLVIVDYTSSSKASATKVIPFQRGAPTASKQVGQIPANWSEGSGTIVSGTTANNATEVALGAYPGGIVDRVVKLSNGEYNVHYIGVNWPHHVFVSASFKVVGAL
jgi:hypothetical protein